MWFELNIEGKSFSLLLLASSLIEMDTLQRTLVMGGKEMFFNKYFFSFLMKDEQDQSQIKAVTNCCAKWSSYSPPVTSFTAVFASAHEQL